LHGFWLLSERLPADILTEAASKKLKGIDVEIKPTPANSLRIPAEKRFLDPQSMQLLNKPIEDACQCFE